MVTIHDRRWSPSHSTRRTSIKPASFYTALAGWELFREDPDWINGATGKATRSIFSWPGPRRRPGGPAELPQRSPRT